MIGICEQFLCILGCCSLIWLWFLFSKFFWFSCIQRGWQCKEFNATSTTYIYGIRWTLLCDEHFCQRCKTKEQFPFESFNNSFQLYSLDCYAANIFICPKKSETFKKQKYLRIKQNGTNIERFELIQTDRSVESLKKATKYFGYLFAKNCLIWINELNDKSHLQNKPSFNFAIAYHTILMPIKANDWNSAIMIWSRRNVLLFLKFVRLNVPKILFLRLNSYTIRHPCHENTSHSFMMNHCSMSIACTVSGTAMDRCSLKLNRNFF